MYTIEKLLSDKKFRIYCSEKTRKNFAEAICFAEKNKRENSEIDIYKTLSELPDDIDVSIDEKGFIRLHEIEPETEKKFSENDREYKLNNIDLFYNEKNNNKSEFAILSDINYNFDDNTDNNTTKIELLRAGNFNHWWYGEIVFDKKYFMSCIENFVNDILHRDISFDAQHEVWAGAVAWLKTLSIKSRKFFDGKRRYVLIGESEFTDEGSSMIKGKRFKYFSIEVSDVYKDKETQEEYGPTVMGGGVTNRPFIPGMLAVELSEDKLFSSVEPDGNKKLDSLHTKKENNKETSLLKKLDDLIFKDNSNNMTKNNIDISGFALINKDSNGNILKRSLLHHNPDGTINKINLKKCFDDIDNIKGFNDTQMKNAREHLFEHLEEVTNKEEKKFSDKTEEGDSEMDLKELIKNLEIKLSELGDSNEELTKSYSEQLTTLKAAQDKIENKSKELDEESKKKFAEQQDKIKEQEIALDEQKKNLENMEQRFAVADEERRCAKIELFCETLEKEKHFPATIEVVKKYLLSDIGQVSITLSEDDKEVKIDLQKMFKEILDSIPAKNRVKLTENLRSEGGDTADVDKKNVVKLEDGNEVSVMDPERRKRALEKAGFKYKENVQ